MGLRTHNTKEQEKMFKEIVEMLQYVSVSDAVALTGMDRTAVWNIMHGKRKSMHTDNLCRMYIALKEYMHVLRRAQEL